MSKKLVLPGRFKASMVISRGSLDLLVLDEPSPYRVLFTGEQYYACYDMTKSITLLLPKSFVDREFNSYGGYS